MTYQQIKNLLQITESPIEKLELMMDFGRSLVVVPDDAICSEISGCASFVQICRVGDKFYGRADSDIVRGIVAIVLAMIDGKSIRQIKDMDIVGEFNSLNLNLGAGRLNGLNAIAVFLQNL